MAGNSSANNNSGRERQEQKASLQWCVAQHDLEEVGQEEKHCEQSNTKEETGQVGATTVRILNDRKGQQWVR